MLDTQRWCKESKHQQTPGVIGHTEVLQNSPHPKATQELLELLAAAIAELADLGCAVLDAIWSSEPGPGANSFALPEISGLDPALQFE